MTGNQKNALELAEKIVRQDKTAVELSERQWHLLLLAAGLNNPCSLPQFVAHKVLREFQSRRGYFAEGQRGSDRTTGLGELSDEAPATGSTRICWPCGDRNLN